MTTAIFDVCVQGAGAVGSSLALALARQGLRVALQAPAARAGAGDIRAYALNAASVDLLRELQVWDALAADAVTAVHDMQVAGDGLGQLRFSAWQQRVSALAWIVDAAALDDALATALRLTPQVIRRETGPDDDRADASLTAWCEGRDSPARERLGVGFELQRYGQRAIATRVVSSRPHAGTAWQWFRSPDVLALLPLDRPEPRSSYAVVWSLGDAAAAAFLAADAASPADDDFDRALNAATGEAAGRLRRVGPLAAWPLVLARAPRVHGPGWVLLGDGAHVIHPLAGQGLNLGLADVAALARVVAAREPWRALGDPKLLARYARERSGPTAAMAHLTDGLLHLFAAPAPAAKELRNRALSLVNHLPALKRRLVARAFGH